MTNDDQARASAWDMLRAGLVVAFAFLSASFAARNADVWLHLATGKALVRRDGAALLDAAG